MITVHALIATHDDELTSDVLERTAKGTNLPTGRETLPALETDTRRFFSALERTLRETKPSTAEWESLTALASDEAHAFAARGLSIASGLALLKCYRASLLALVERVATTDDEEPTPQRLVHAPFNTLELAFVDAWETIYEEEELQPLHRELDRKNIDLARFQRIISGLPLPVIVLDNAQRTEHLNQAAIAFLQDASGDMPPDNATLTGPGEILGDLPWIAKEIHAFCASNAPYTAFEHLFPTANGERTFSVRLHRQGAPDRRNASSLRPGVVVVLREASDKQTEEAFHRLAFYDDLTGLPSRALLLDRLSIEVPRAIRSGRILIVAILQIDGFDALINALGYEGVSFMLIELSVRLQATVRRSDTLAFFDAGSFGALLPDAVHKQDMEIVTTELLDAFDEPFDINGTTTALTASIGVALCPDDASTPTELVTLARNAMKAAQETGGDGWVHARQVRDES